MIFEDMDNWVECEIRNDAVWRVTTKEGYRKGFDLNPNVERWLVDRLGDKRTVRHLGVWSHDIPVGITTTTIFSFADKDEAILFKLTWG